VKTTTVRTVVVPVLALALAGVTAPAASAAPPVEAVASTTLTTTSPKSSTVEEAVTRSGARRMRTTATWFPAEGRIVATTRTSNSVKATGFTGGVTVVFLDREGHVVGFTGVRTFGVDGTWIGRATRTDVWQERVPDAPANAVAPLIGIGINVRAAVLPPDVAALDEHGHPAESWEDEDRVAAELLTGDRLDMLIAALLERFDHVVIDSPPVMGRP